MILDLVPEVELELDATDAAERGICCHAVIEVLKTAGGDGPNFLAVVWLGPALHVGASRRAEMGLGARS